MTAQTVSQIDNDFNRRLHNFIYFYIHRINLLVELLYSKGVTPVEISKCLGITRQAVSLHWPWKKYEEKGKQSA